MKAKYISLVAFLFGIALTLQAEDKAKNYLGFLAGSSFATGDFSSTGTGTLNNWNNSAGFAKTGFNVGVEGAYYFGANLGVVGTINFSDHGRFVAGDVQKLGDSFTDAFAVDESTVKTTGRYRSLTFMAGPQLSFPFRTLTIDIRAMGGLLTSLSTPEITVLLEDQTDATFTQKSSTTSAFGWMAGAGLRYALTDKLGLMFRADYISSDGVKIENTNRANNAGRLVTKQPMSWVNTTIGIAYSFGHIKK